LRGYAAPRAFLFLGKNGARGFGHFDR
jgi:hypothetical protein